MDGVAVAWSRAPAWAFAGACSQEMSAFHDPHRPLRPSPAALGSRVRHQTSVPAPSAVWRIFSMRLPTHPG